MTGRSKQALRDAEDVQSLKLPVDKLDSDAVSVCHRLQQAGFTAYLVGGCVRDILIGSTPKDFDVGTSATPAQVRRVFRNCRLLGRRFRLAHVRAVIRVCVVVAIRSVMHRQPPQLVCFVSMLISVSV